MNKDLIQEVKELLDEIDSTYKYSVSKIYGTYNKVFNKNESPQSCASCLIRKARELRKWLNNITIEKITNFSTLKNKISDDNKSIACILKYELVDISLNIVINSFENITDIIYKEGCKWFKIITDNICETYHFDREYSTHKNSGIDPFENYFEGFMYDFFEKFGLNYLTFKK